MNYKKWAVAPFLFLSFNVFSVIGDCTPFAGELLFFNRVGTQPICWNSRTLVSPDSTVMLHCTANPSIILEDGSGAYSITNEVCNPSQGGNPTPDPNNPDPLPQPPDTTTMTKALGGLYYEARQTGLTLRTSVLPAIQKSSADLQQVVYNSGKNIEQVVESGLSNTNSTLQGISTTVSEGFASLIMNQDNTSFTLTTMKESLNQLVYYAMIGSGSGSGSGSEPSQLEKDYMSWVQFYTSQTMNNTRRTADTVKNIETTLNDALFPLNNNVSAIRTLQETTLNDIKANTKLIADALKDGSGSGDNSETIEKLVAIDNSVKGLGSNIQSIKNQLEIDSSKGDQLKQSVDSVSNNIASVKSEIKGLSDFVKSDSVVDGSGAANLINLPDYDKQAVDAIKNIEKTVSDYSDQSGLTALTNQSQFNNLFSSASSISQIFSIAQSSCQSINFGSNSSLDLCPYAPTISNVLEFIIWALTILFIFTYTSSLLTRERLT